MSNTFYCDFNLTGADRKQLVKAISAFTGEDSRYLGAPSFAYEVGGYHIDKNGVVSFDDRDQADTLIAVLAEHGFVSVASNLTCEDEVVAAAPAAELEEAPAPDGLTITLPKDGFTELALDNLQKLVDAKAALVQKALGADRLTIETTEDHVSFPWWDRLPEPDETQAYMAFIAAISAMAKEAKRVNAIEKEVESEKYAFRCFLLRLGFIGAESKTHRKLLLKNLSGSSAFKASEKAAIFNADQKAKRDSAKAAANSEEGSVCE